MQSQIEEQKQEQDPLFDDDEEDPTGLLKIISNSTKTEKTNLKIKWKNYIHEEAEPNSQINEISQFENELDYEVKRAIDFQIGKIETAEGNQQMEFLLPKK